MTDFALPEGCERLNDAHRTISSFEFARTFTFEIENHWDEISDTLRGGRLNDGIDGNFERYIEAMEDAAECRRRLDAAWQDHDVLLTAAAFGEAPVGIAAFAGVPLYQIWTTLHVPAISLPVFKGPNGHAGRRSVRGPPPRRPKAVRLRALGVATSDLNCNEGQLGDEAMVSTPTEPNWAVTFPGNLRWSNAMQIVKGMVAYGAAAMAEIDLITQRLKARAGEGDPDKAWKEEWSREADRVAAIGDAADAEGRKITAGNQYMRAGNYYYSAERFIPPGDEKLAMYAKALRCYQARDGRGCIPDIERVEVPYEGTSLPAWFVKGRGLGRRPDRGAVRRHGQRQGDERDLRRPRLRQARHQHARDRRAGPIRAAAAAQHPQPARLRGRRHRRLRLRRRAAGRSIRIASR